MVPPLSLITMVNIIESSFSMYRVEEVWHVFVYPNITLWLYGNTTKWWQCHVYHAELGNSDHRCVLFLFSPLNNAFSTEQADLWCCSTSNWGMLLSKFIFPKRKVKIQCFIHLFFISLMMHYKCYYYHLYLTVFWK